MAQDSLHSLNELWIIMHDNINYIARKELKMGVDYTSYFMVGAVKRKPTEGS